MIKSSRVACTTFDCLRTSVIERHLSQFVYIHSDMLYVSLILFIYVSAGSVKIINLKLLEL